MTEQFPPRPRHFSRLHDRLVHPAGGGHWPFGVSVGRQRPPLLATVELPRWAASLAPITYDPLSFFSPPTRAEYEGAARPPGEIERLEMEICQLGIRLKELELLSLIGEGFNAPQYKLLQALRDEKIQRLRARKKLKR